MSVIGSILAKLELDITNFSSNLSKVQSDIESTGKKLDGLSNLGNGLTSVGKSLTTSLTVPIVGVGTAAVALATDFEYSMSQVQAISGATGDDFEDLRDEAIKLGGSTKYSAGEVADAMTEMAKAGWSTEQILDGMSGVLDAAAASGEGLASVSTIVADAITGFGLEAGDSARIADLLTQAANSGTIGINDLGESFKYIAPVAQSMGFSVEDVTTAISAMSMAGIKGSQAGTSLRTMLTNLVKPTDEMAAAMDELGIQVANEDGTMKSLDEILNMMRGSFSGLTDEQKSYYAAVLAGKTGMSGMLSLMNLSQEEYDKIATSMDNSGGVAQETAEVMQNNLKSALEQLGGALESLAIRIGDQLIPIIRKVAEYITAFTEKLAGASEEQIQTAIKVAALVAAIGPLVMIVGKIITTFVAAKKAITAVKSAFTIVKAAIAASSAPILAIVAVVGVLVAAFTTLWKTNEGFRNKMTEIWQQIKDTIGGFLQGIVDRLNSLGFEFENITDVLWTIWKGFCDLLAPLFEGVFQNIANILKTVLDVILGVVDFFIAVFTGDWEGAWNAVKGIFESIWNGMVSWLENIGNTLLGVLDVILGWFGTSWSECWNGIKTFFVELWNGIVSWFQGILTGISTFFTNIWTGISTFFQNIWNGITSFFTSIITGIVTFVQTNFGGLFTSIQNIFNGIKDFFTGVWELIKNIFLGAILLVIDLVTGNFEMLKSDVINLWNNIKEAFSTVWEAIKSIFSNALEAIKTVFTGAMNVMKTVGTTVWNAIKTFFSTVLNGIKTIFTNVWNAIKTFFTNAVNNIKNTAVNTFNSMKTGISNVVSNIKTTIVNGFNKAIEWIKSLPSQAVTWGKDMIQGIINGIKGMISKVGDAVKGVADKIRSFLHFSVPDEGPLTDYESWMPDMIEGFTKTLNNAAPGLYKAAEAVAGGLSNVFGNDNLQASMAGAYGSISGGTTPIQSLGNSAEAVRTAKTGGTINIEKIEVRDDDDIDELTQGLYNHNDKSLRAMGRRNL